MWIQKFTRPKGFSGSLPRNWIDDALPVCPFCHSDPIWEFGLKAGWINRYHFRCTNIECKIVISINAPDVLPKAMSMMNFGIGTTKKKIMKFENNGGDPELMSLVNKEFTLGDLQQMSEGHSDVRICNHCQSSISSDAKYCTDCGKKPLQDRICSHCQSSISSDAKFCTDCGGQLNA